uniref:Uncharacterized protein n=1 Tax=Marmota marmota marmota TaxID=9994 RepID=A0A8C6EWS6_MARMA
MSSGVGMLTAFLFLLDVGGAQVLATDKSAGEEIDTIVRKKRPSRDAQVIEL